MLQRAKRIIMSHPNNDLKVFFKGIPGGFSISAVYGGGVGSVYRVTLLSKVHLEGSNIRTAEEDMVDVFLMVITEVTLCSGIDNNVLVILPSWKSIVLEKPYDGFDFIRNV